MLSDNGTPIFVQIAELIENDIVEGNLAEESQVPSTNEFAAYYRINPATAAKGVQRLVANGILYKKRGIGMFVAANARAVLIEERRRRFVQHFIEPLRTEAAKLGITADEVVEMLSQSVPAEQAGQRR
jgi:DNA-binding transcriptional regulator YhcF (GntR family)